MAGRAELAKMAGRAELAKMAGRAELAKMAGRVELAKMAGRAEIAKMAGRAELAKMAGRVELAKMAPFTLPQQASSTEQSATAAKRKFRTQFKTKPPGDKRISWKRCFSPPRGLQQGIARWTDTCSAICGKNTIIAGTSTG